MAQGNEQALPITGFKGLDKSQPVPRDGFTRSLQNVNVREGKVTGRGGVTFDSTFGTAMSEGILQLAPYIDTSLATTLLRIGPTKVEKSTNGGAWSDITGTAFNGAAGDKPQWADFRNTLFFTNEGKDTIRYWEGTGNTTAVSSAPKCKGILSYHGFLILLHIFDTTDNEFKTRRAQYSETPTTDWSACAAQILNFNETPGGVVAGVPFGESAAILKEDGVVILRWVGGPVVFNQRLIRGAFGTIAPLSAQAIGEKGVIYLGTDYELGIVDNTAYTPLPPNVNDILQNDLYKTDVANCRSILIPSEETYSLFFPRDSGGNTGRINFNYRTGEFSYSTYPSHAVAAAQTVKWTKTADETPIIAVSTKTYTIDTTAKADNTSATASTEISRFYDTDWLQFINSNEGRVVHTASTFTGATLVFEANAYTKCKVSVAVDRQNNFRFTKTYDLRAKRSGDEYVWVRYDVPPIKCEWVNLRIEFINSTTAKAKLLSGALHLITDDMKRDVRRSASTAEA